LIKDKSNYCGCKITSWFGVVRLLLKSTV